MPLSDLINTVSKFSPIIGTALAGPAGGIVTTLIANAFGAPHDDIPQLTTAIQNHPESLIKLKELELQLQSNQLGDVQSARARDEYMIDRAANPNATWVVSFVALMPHLLTLLNGAAVVVILPLAMFLMNIFYELPQEINAVFIGIEMYLLAIFGKQAQMYYGGSLKKEEKG